MNSPAETAARQPYSHTCAEVLAFARTLPIAHRLTWPHDKNWPLPLRARFALMRANDAAAVVRQIIRDLSIS